MLFRSPQSCAQVRPVAESLMDWTHSHLILGIKVVRMHRHGGGCFFGAHVQGPQNRDENPSRGIVCGRAGALCASHRQAFVRRSEEHTSELQSLMRTSYAVLCLKKK